jgi:hypothetical protein
MGKWRLRDAFSQIGRSGTPANVPGGTAQR